MKEKQSEKYGTQFSRQVGAKDEKTKEIPNIDRKEKHNDFKDGNRSKRAAGFPDEKKRDKPLQAGENFGGGNRAVANDSAKIQNRRVFFTAFVVTLCILSFGIGILQADYYCRQTGFGDENTLIHRITGKNGDLLDFFLSL